ETQIGRKVWERAAFGGREETRRDFRCRHPRIDAFDIDAQDAAVIERDEDQITGVGYIEFDVRPVRARQCRLAGGSIFELQRLGRTGENAADKTAGDSA